MGRRSKFPPEVRERAVRMVMEQEGSHDSQWAAISSIAEKLGCAPETLRGWVRQAEKDTGKRAGVTTSERERLNELEREVRELRAKVGELVLELDARKKLDALTGKPEKAF